MAPKAASFHGFEARFRGFSAQAGRDSYLGEGMVEFEDQQFPPDGLVQAICEPRRYVTQEETCWLVYSRKEAPLKGAAWSIVDL